MTEVLSRLGLRTAVLGGALALLLSACGEPTQEGGEQQQGAVPESGQSSDMAAGDATEQTDTSQQ